MKKSVLLGYIFLGIFFVEGIVLGIIGFLEHVCFVQYGVNVNNYLSAPCCVSTVLGFLPVWAILFFTSPLVLTISLVLIGEVYNREKIANKIHYRLGNFLSNITFILFFVVLIGIFLTRIMDFSYGDPFIFTKSFAGIPMIFSAFIFINLPMLFYIGFELTGKIHKEANIRELNHEKVVKK